MAGPCYAVILGIYSLSFSSPLLNKSERKDRMHYTWITGWQTAQHMAPILLGWAWEISINSTKACMVLKAQRKEMGSCWRAVGQTIWGIRVKGRQKGSLFVKIFRKITTDYWSRVHGFVCMCTFTGTCRALEAFNALAFMFKAPSSCPYLCVRGWAFHTKS